MLDSDEDTSEKSTDEDRQCSALEELTDLHFKFEVKEVCGHVTQRGRSVEVHVRQWCVCVCGVFRCCWS